MNEVKQLAEIYIDKMPCSTFEIYVYAEVKKAFIAGYNEKSNEYESLVKANRELLEALKGVLDYRSLSINSSVDYRNKFTENTNKALEAIKKHSPIN